MKKIGLTILLGMICLALHAQNDSLTRCPIARERQLFHIKIDNEQKNILKADGRADSLLRVSSDEDINMQVTYAVVNKVDYLQASIECNRDLSNTKKLTYLRSLQDMLAKYLLGWRNRKLNPVLAPQLVNLFANAVAADIQGQSYENFVEADSYEIGTILVNCFAMNENPGYTNARYILFRKYAALYPAKVLSELRKDPGYPFADSLVRVTAQRFPTQVYDYALDGRSKLGQIIRKCEDPLVLSIAKIAQDPKRQGQFYLPFLHNLGQQRVSYDSVAAVIADSVKYFKLLVKAAMDYAKDIAEGKTVVAKESMDRMLNDRVKKIFVGEINRLHELQPPQRFKILEPFTPQELYYIAIMAEDEIYTSSYIGTYDRMMQRMAAPRGDSLLMNLHFDRFKKFIKLAAGYNKLSHFLSTMEKERAQAIMRAFATGLDKSKDIMDIEEAVDVADSYASIVDKKELQDIGALMLQQVQNNLGQSRQSGNAKGNNIYNILDIMFRSAKDTALDLSAVLGIPPVYKMDYKQLTDDSGRVVQLVFFYGDKDGQGAFGYYLNRFNGADWKIDQSNKEWVTIRSLKGKIWIYANRPLDYQKDLDAQAQRNLIAYLAKNKIYPTVTVHRGHSYWVKYTIEQLPLSSKVVILGSCGGYHNLDLILNKCPDAQIVSSKQTGSGSINNPIIFKLNDKVRSGRNIEWIPFWKELEQEMVGDPHKKDLFDDYVPPHKNLGAIFIKAYKKAVGE
jgi:hypothetical protein